MLAHGLKLGKSAFLEEYFVEKNYQNTLEMVWWKVFVRLVLLPWNYP